MQILDPDQTTAIQTDTLDYSGNFDGGTRISSAPKKVYTGQNGEQNRKFDVMDRKGEKNQTMFSYLHDSKCQKQLNLNTD